MRIDNKEITTPIIDIMLKLRQELGRLGIQKFNQMKVVGDNLQVTCPFHKDGLESHASAGISLKSTDTVQEATFHCFTCQKVATLPELVEFCFGVNTLNHEYGKKWLIDNFGGDDIIERPTLEIEGRKSISPRQYITEAQLSQYRYYHPYMYKRKLTDEIITKFDVGYDKDTNSLTFPTNDEFGNCLFITRRNVNNKYFNYPSRVLKPVYGLDKLPKDCKTVIVCESIINALTCYVYGYPAIALLGLGTTHQYEILKRSPIRTYLLGFDGDSAGDKGAEKFIENLKSSATIIKLDIPRGKDINDLEKEEFEKILKTSKNHLT